MNQNLPRTSNGSASALLIGALVLVALLGALVLLLRDAPESQSQSESPIAAPDEQEQKSGGRPRTAADDSADNPSDKYEAGAENQPAIDRAQPLNNAFSYRMPILAALEEAAVNGALSYDQMMRNLGTWRPLCANVNGFGNHLAGFEFESESDVLKRDLEEFCEGFTKRQQTNIDESLEVAQEDGGPDSLRRLRDDPLNRSDPQLGVQSAVRALVDALDRYDYATVLEVIWYLGIELPVSVESGADTHPLADAASEPEVLFAVAAATFCREIGGCPGQHPIPVGLCFTFQERPCNRGVNGIDDAVNQILTGAEIEHFVTMYDWLWSLIGRHRAGDF